MLPTFQIFHRTIAMYGLMIIIGILFGVTVASLRSRRRNIPGEDIIFASCYAGIGLILGAKLLYIITIIPEFIRYHNQFFSNPSIIRTLLTEGFVFYGGLFGAVIGYLIYCRQYRIKFLNMMDIMAPSIPLIHGFGRLGCLFAGCCYGISYHGPFHITFHNSVAAPNDVALFPIQPVESALNFTAGIFLLFYARHIRRPGKTIGLYLIYYSVMRFTLEFFRGDITRGHFLSLSTSQWISIALLPFALWIFFGLRPVKLPLKGQK
jgi:phosphatidylglycerol:prolipoprotein diacylglycerol transferase